jgi:hypothetical protein
LSITSGEEKKVTLFFNTEQLLRSLESNIVIAPWLRSRLASFLEEVNFILDKVSTISIFLDSVL